MGTHCLIAAKMADGKYVSSYCHYDGYPENQMQILPVQYNTIRKARALAKIGYMSGLMPTAAACKKDAANTALPHFHNSIHSIAIAAQNCGAYHVYVYENGEWNYHKVQEKLRWNR